MDFFLYHCSMLNFYAVEVSQHAITVIHRILPDLFSIVKMVEVELLTQTNCEGPGFSSPATLAVQSQPTSHTKGSKSDIHVLRFDKA